MHGQWGSRSARRPYRFWGLTVLAVGVFAGCVALALGWWSPAGITGSAIVPAAGVVGAALCLYAAARGPRGARRSWAFFSLVLSLYAGGDILWLAFGGAAGTPPILSIADALYLFALVPAILGLAFYPVAHLRRGTLGPLIFDAAVLGTAALLISYLLVFDEVGRLGGSTLDVLLLLIYPITDVLLACAVVLLLLRSVGAPRPDLVLIGLCFATYALTDNGYALMTVRGQDSTGSVVDLGYLIAPLFLGLAAFTSTTRRPGSRTMERHLSGLTASLLPDLGAIAALALFVTFHHPGGTAAWFLAAATLGLTGVRQVSLTADRQRVRRDLERRVAAGNEDFRELTLAHQKLESMKYEFVSAVSHELRTPLTAIHGALELLADGDAGALPAKAEDVVGLASRGTRRLTRLVDDIIDLERLERGMFSITPRDELLAPLLADAVVPLVSLAQERDLALVLTPVSETARCDGDRVIQAVVNLVGNALKFTPPGGTVTVSTATSDEGVVVAVADEGRGIPADELNSVFERFHQVRASDDREHAGAGLGLTITKHIVEAQGGRIWVESTVGRGSTFRFTLPHADVDAPLGPGAPAPSAAVGQADPRAG